MSKPFIEYHLLTSYPGTLLNRDDRGFPKKLQLGGTTRTRVSSQAQKYHWRNYDGQDAIQNLGPMSIRSRETFYWHLAAELAEDYDPELSVVIATKLKDAVFDDDGLGDLPDSDDESFSAVLEQMEEDPQEVSGSALGSNDEPLSVLCTNAPKVVGPQEVSYLATVAEQVLQENESREDVEDLKLKDLEGDVKNNLKAMGKDIGLDGAMHGRMVTSDVLARVNAAVHVAHAHTVGKQQREDDFFTAVDQLAGGSGASHNDTKQLTSGLYYLYVAVDVPLLTANLEGCGRSEWKEQDLGLTKALLEAFCKTICYASIGAKRGPTAPYALPTLALVEAGDRRQLAQMSEAFVPPIEAKDVGHAASQALVDEVRGCDRLLGEDATADRAYASRVDLSAEGVARDVGSIPDLANWTTTHLA
ncbi:type I-E CRISPR-associated protein Cas7/Cse4/CasC [Salinibacter grassmerensis]|uniref:type I-E CRISPR-associated protein Cas7/Cse4/CasC n=1 Tax=Salinibacter grassmerensis TaxID=3040353 RepID=UPI0021E76DAD|nr:type I-E CRISPR-associated protein Cas7/Cse4/CasC [Salinibacter grassmerensis]